jgi:hypothetical protein
MRAMNLHTDEPGRAAANSAGPLCDALPAVFSYTWPRRTTLDGD